MRITIHRGENQIGGNIVEIASEKAKIILDIGCELDEGNKVNVPNVPGLFDYKGCDAIFISHNHLDHVGLASKVHKDIPIYMGDGAYKILKASNDYQRKDTVKPFKLFNGDTGFICIGDLTITPILVDHSAFDSYMFLIQDGKEKVLYTGDFRGNGRKDFTVTLSKLPRKINTLICEGTTLSRSSQRNEKEKELEVRITEEIKKHKGPVFVMQSSMNIDRIVTIYKASRSCGRVFLEDFYMAEVTSSAGSNIPNPKSFKNVRVFTTKKIYGDKYEKFNSYGVKKIGKKDIPNKRFTMSVRSSMINYLIQLSQLMSFEDGILIYSMWRGYKKQSQMKEFLKICKELGLDIKYFHTSGHADSFTIMELIEHINPTTIMPIHTENAEWFKALQL